MSYNELPIFCDNCSALAFAELDTAPLCMDCLLKAVNRSGTHTARIEPLKFNEPRIITKSSVGGR